MFKSKSKIKEDLLFTIGFSIAGGIIALLYSYFLQDPFIQEKIPLGKYIRLVPDILIFYREDINFLGLHIFEILAGSLAYGIILGAFVGHDVYKIRNMGVPGEDATKNKS